MICRVAHCPPPLLLRLGLALTLAVALSCDKPSPSRAPQDGDAARHAALRRALPARHTEVQDLLATSPLFEAMQPEALAAGDPTRAARAVLAHIHALRRAKALQLGGVSQAPATRPVHELARLLLSPAPLSGLDQPTSELELAALAALTLRSAGFEARVAVASRATEASSPLERPALAVRSALGEDAPWTVLDVLAEGAPELDAERHEALEDVEVLGLHHARRAGYALLLEQRQLAERELELALALAPQRITPRYVRAALLEDLDLDQVVRDLSVISARRETPDVWLRLGRALRKQGHHQNAEVILNHIGPEEALYDEARLELARGACAEGDTARFLLYAAQATVADATFWEAYRDLALVTLVQGEADLLEEALEGGQRALPSSPIWQTLYEARELPAERWPSELARQLKQLGACAEPSGELAP